MWTHFHYNFIEVIQVVISVDLNSLKWERDTWSWKGQLERTTEVGKFVLKFESSAAVGKINFM